MNAAVSADVEVAPTDADQPGSTFTRSELARRSGETAAARGANGTACPVLPWLCTPGRAC